MVPERQSCSSRLPELQNLCPRTLAIDLVENVDIYGNERTCHALWGKRGAMFRIDNSGLMGGAGGEDPSWEPRVWVLVNPFFLSLFLFLLSYTLVAGLGNLHLVNSLNH